VTGPLIVGVLAAAGVYLVMQRGLLRTVIGFVLVQHAVNILVVLAGGPRGAPPFAGVEEFRADPLVQAFALTAIVVGLGTTLFLVSLAMRSGQLEEPAADESDADHGRGGP
jgi:multicomponent Na+:H+ antiporter subunit C